MDILEKYQKEQEKMMRERPQARIYSSETPKMIQLVMKYFDGFIKDERQAFYVLIGFIMAAILIIIYFTIGGGERPKIPPPPTDYPFPAPNKLRL